MSTKSDSNPTPGSHKSQEDFEALGKLFGEVLLQVKATSGSTSGALPEVPKAIDAIKEFETGLTGGFGLPFLTNR